jgi:gas vesicle protein
MDDWSKQWFDVFGNAVQSFTQQLAQDTDRWIDEVSERLAIATETLAQATDQWVDQVQEAIDPEVDRIVDQIDQAVEPLRSSINLQLDEVVDQLSEVLGPLVVGLSSVDQWLEEVTGPINSTVEPMLQNYPACVGCRNFYGQAHAGTTLVCAMHPFGPEEERHCPDWETFWPPAD